MNEETDFSTFIKNRITELRCQKGISEYTLSLAIGRSQGYIQSISSGRILPSMNTFLDICKYFDITPTEFFDPSFQNPTLLHSIISDISKFYEEDLLLLSSVLKRITRN